MMEKICGECGHYHMGHLENPCSINPRYVGYLKVGCTQWIKKEETVNDQNMRVCKRCGSMLPKWHFQRSSYICNDCKETIKRKRKKI